jgi:hypothetical protein
MHRLPRGFVALVALIVLALATMVPTAAAQSTSTTTTTGSAPITAVWTRVTDAAGRNIDEVGVARTADGVLHVLWRQKVPGGNQEQVVHTPVSTVGEVGSTVVASSPWGSAGNPAVIVTSDGGLRIFFGGLTGSNAQLDGVQSASAKADGQTWTPQGGRGSSPTCAVPEGVGAGLRSDGTPVFTYAYSFALGLHAGLDPATPDTDLRTTTTCCDYLPNLAFTKGGTGVLAWFSNADGEVGTWAQPIAPSMGTKVLAPGSVSTDGKALSPSQRTPVVTRTGTEEVYLAYCGGYPTCTQVLLWKVGSATPITVATGRDVESVNVASDPDGRLWMRGEDAADRSLHVARSNDDATEFGAPVAFTGPTGTETIWKVQGNALKDSIDVLASATTPGSLATWHTNVLPGLAVDSASGTGGVTFTVTDAGTPVAGAKVKLGKKTVTTDKKGKATAKGRGVAEVTKAGYSPATAAVA